MSLKGVKGFGNLEDPDKVLVRSDGTATYVAKDIAYQMWKFGLLGADFHYRPYQEGLWTTTSDEGEVPPGVPFGHADHVFNVIDIGLVTLKDDHLVRLRLRQDALDLEATLGTGLMLDLLRTIDETRIGPGF